ncbi:MAG: ribonuclease R, partial [Sphingomonadaceae bacterium]
MPSKEQILTFIQTSPVPAGKREIAREFGLKGQEKIALKKLLRDMADEGLIDGKKTAYHRMGGIPKVTVLRIIEIDDGEPLAVPDSWQPDDGAKPPVLRVIEQKKGAKKQATLRKGDRILARTEETGGKWLAYPMKKLAARTEGLMGVVELDGSGQAWLAPVDRRVRSASRIADIGSAEEGQLVLAEPAGRFPRSGVNVVETLGNPLAPNSFSLIAIAKYGIQHVFSSEVLDEAERAANISLEGDRREDLRDIPIVAIDPADARDHDDAI